MKNWCVGISLLLVSGCSNRFGIDTSFAFQQELDGGDNTAYFQQSIKNSGTGQSGFKFTVDPSGENPIKNVDTFSISTNDSIEISLSTLSYLQEDVHIPLLKANTIVQNGMPRVIGPQGYDVRLAIHNNQMIAIIKSITQPDEQSRTVSVNTGDNDIVVGDLTPVRLLMAGAHKNLGVNLRYNVGLEAYKSNDNQHQYVSYVSSSQWFGQFSKSYTGADTLMSTQFGYYWDCESCGKFNVCVQNLYRVGDAKSINNASLKYITNIPSSSYQGQVMLATTFDNNHTTAIGVGLIFNHLQGGTVQINAVITELLWEMSISGSLNL